MQIVIDIPEEKYKDILLQHNYDCRWESNYERMIANGAPLAEVIENIKAEITKEKDEKGFCVWYYDNLMEKFDKHIGGKEQK